MVATLLEEREIVTPTYREALITREKSFPTGLDMEFLGKDLPNVAIPHTDIVHNLAEKVVVVQLEKPVTFYNMIASNKIKSFGMKGEYKTDSATVKDYSNNAYGVAYVHEFEIIRFGERSGFYAGAIYNRYNFKDIGHSKEDQYMMKAGLFKTTPFDENGNARTVVSGLSDFTKASPMSTVSAPVLA